MLYDNQNSTFHFFMVSRMNEKIVWRIDKVKWITDLVFIILKYFLIAPVILEIINLQFLPLDFGSAFAPIIVLGAFAFSFRLTNPPLYGLTEHDLIKERLKALET